jgi:Cof subfamily protein (haloacid dehalogenase superfamily)
MRKIKIVITDLDRTLFKNDHTISERNLETLFYLQNKNITTVIATGRNIFSANKVLPDDLPFDYLMFSSGCGIMDWSSKKVIFKNHLTKKETLKVVKILIKHKVDFMIHDLIPDNHKFVYWRVNTNNPDFERRIQIYKNHAEELSLPLKPQEASQLIAVLPSNSNEKFLDIKKEIDFLKIIRATSPLDHSSIWLEVFPKEVSKGFSTQWLCEYLSIPKECTLSLGNDFNDIDLLEWTENSFVVENAPQELKVRFKVTDSNENDGFSKVITDVL